MKPRSAVFPGRHEAWTSKGQLPDEYYFQEKLLPPSLVVLRLRDIYLNMKVIGTMKRIRKL